MRCIVTGCAGFIGSNLAEKLLDSGYAVTGIDCFTDFYSRNIKENNLTNLRGRDKFTFQEGNILKIDLKNLLNNTDYVFHLAAQANVHSSWEENFKIYVENNILATQKLLEAAKDCNIKKFIYASSSSVYGDAKTLPTSEEIFPRPMSPYGVSKLAGEHLCYLYGQNFGVLVVCLRYFSVYGPRQRPDMAFHKFIKAALEDREITIYGDGKQTRDFTFVSDVVEATLQAAESGNKMGIYNIGGGTRVPLNQTVTLLEDLLGKKIRLKYVKKQKGDVQDTCAEISKAKQELGYNPKVSLEEGLKRQIEYQKELRV